jgi:hypothetical protein
MLVFFKPNIGFISEHAVDPDKRRYAMRDEGQRHFIDIDHYGSYPFASLPRSWNTAISVYPEDTLKAYGIVPWWIQIMLQRLTAAFRERNSVKILKLSAEIGHYISDAHVPLHACSNHNGQFSNQQGIHGFWESRIPELLAEKEWDFFVGKAGYISNPLKFTWEKILESAVASDSVLIFEKNLNKRFAPDQKFSFEERNGIIIRQYSSAYSIAYNKLLNNMIERRMVQSVYAVASFWYTAWINAGQPDLKSLTKNEFTTADLEEFKNLDIQWKKGVVNGKSCN